MEEKEVILKDLDRKIVIRELSWDEYMTLIDEGYNTKLFMSLCLKDPGEEIFKQLTREQGLQLLQEMQQLNKTDESLIPDTLDEDAAFQTQSKKK